MGGRLVGVGRLAENIAQEGREWWEAGLSVSRGFEPLAYAPTDR